MSRVPIRLMVGRRNIRVTEEGSAAALGRGLSDAFSEIEANFGWYVQQLEGYLPGDLKEALRPTFEKSQEWCPKDTHALVNSGYLEEEKFRNGARVEMGYGRGGIPDYAIYVHEVPMRHAEPTRDKWLQAAVDEDYYTIIQRVTDIIKERSGT